MGIPGVGLREEAHWYMVIVKALESIVDMDTIGSSLQWGPNEYPLGEASIDCLHGLLSIHIGAVLVVHQCISQLGDVLELFLTHSSFEFYHSFHLLLLPAKGTGDVR